MQDPLLSEVDKKWLRKLGYTIKEDPERLNFVTEKTLLLDLGHFEGVMHAFELCKPAAVLTGPPLPFNE